MSEKPPVTPPPTKEEFVSMLNTVTQSLELFRGNVEVDAERLRGVLEWTNCKKVLEEIFGGKVEFIVEGTYAGKFITSAIPAEKLNARGATSPEAERAALAFMMLGDYGIQPEVIISPEEQENLRVSFAIDPSKPGFLEGLEKYLVNAKMPARGDPSTAAYRETEKKAMRAAQKELWGEVVLESAKGRN